MCAQRARDGCATFAAIVIECQRDLLSLCCSCVRNALLMQLTRLVQEKEAAAANAGKKKDLTAQERLEEAKKALQAQGVRVSISSHQTSAVPCALLRSYPTTRSIGRYVLQARTETRRKRPRGLRSHRSFMSRHTAPASPRVLYILHTRLPHISSK